MHLQFRAARLGQILAVAIVTLVAASIGAQDKDLSANYTWAPVKIGAGGWIRGMAVSPSDPTRMYARGDVENLYRWNNAAQSWVPTKLASAFPSSITAAPTGAGAGAIAIDPKNPDHILVAYQFTGSVDVAANPSINLNVYASFDGGVTFKAGNLNLMGNLSSQTSGERLAFDPNNGNVAYFGSPGALGASDGLYRTVDGGLTWVQITAGGYLANTASVRYESQLPRVDGGGSTVQISGQTVSSIIYVTYIKHDETNSDAVSGGGVIMSSDGGQTWTDVTNPLANNICGTNPAAQLCWATVDSAGDLWVSDGNSSHNIFRLTRAGAWTTVSTPNGGAGGIAVDPNNSNRIFIDAGDVLQRSLDGGKTWVVLGNSYTWSTTQPILWLNPSSFRPQGYFVSESGLYFDSKGNLWQPCGNNGVITTTPNDATDSASNPPTWTTVAEGIEEMETSAATIPPGGVPVLGVADESEFTISDPDTYTALHYPISTWANGGYGLGMSQDVAYAPNAPNFVVVPDANDETSQATQSNFQYGGYSNDGGTTWTEFPSVTKSTHPCVLYGGEIAVSARPAGQQNAPGFDNIVWFPTNAGDHAPFAQVPAPFYSKDGGTTWTQTQSFNKVANAITSAECPSNTSYIFLPPQMGDWLYILAEHQLVADPLTPGTFYLKTTFGPSSSTDGGFWKSIDGGATWTETAGSTLTPNYTHWGRMAANPNLSGDLWLVDGWQGAHSHGLYHTTDAGNSFTKSTAFTYAWQVALGKAAPSQSYPAIYVYGLLATDPQWGIFQSIDGGTTFNRISYYPYGIFDIPYDMAASWDAFGTLYVGFAGNSFVYAQYNAGDPQAAEPTFSPAAGPYQSAQTITIADATPNAEIYYTIDGSAPTINSSLYGGAIAVTSGTETINAFAVASGYSPSSVASAEYSVTALPTAATPTFNPSGGTYTSVQTVSIGDTTANAAIFYTTDGTTATTSSTQYSNPIAVSSSETIQAIATATGFSTSNVGSAAYTINLPAPTFSLSLSPQSLTIQSGGSGTITATVTPANGFNAAVTFACSGLPSGASCSFNPSSVTPSGSAITTQLTVSSVSTAGAVHNASLPLLHGAALAAALFFLGWKKRSLFGVAFVVLAIAAGLTPASGCGGSSSNQQQTQPVTVTVTVTATSGALQQTSQFTLTIN